MTKKLAFFSCWILMNTLLWSQHPSEEINYYYQEGLSALQKKDYTQAIHYFNEVLRMNPRSNEAYRERGVAQLCLGEGKNAIRDFSRALEINPSDALSYYYRFQTRIQLKDLAGAKLDSVQYLKLTQQDTREQTQRHRIDIFSQFPELSTNSKSPPLPLEEEKSVPNEEKTRFDLNPILKKLNQPDYRLRLIAVLRLTSEPNSETLSLLYEIANQDSHEEVRKLAQECLAQFPSSSKLDQIVQELSRSTPEQIQIQVKTLDGTVQQQLVPILLKMFQEENEVLRLKILIAFQTIAPYAQETLPVLKHYLLACGKETDSEEYLKSLLDTLEKIQQSNQKLPVKPEIKSDNISAVPTEHTTPPTKELKLSDPVPVPEKEKTPLDAQQLFRQGIAKGKQSDFAGGISDLDRAIELDPSSSLYFYTRGLLKFKMQQTMESVPDFDEALRLNPKLSEAYLYRGRARSKNSEDRMLAIRDFNNALELSPQEDSIYYYRGLVYHEAEDSLKSQSDFRQYLQKTQESTDSTVQKNRKKIFEIYPQIQENL